MKFIVECGSITRANYEAIIVNLFEGVFVPGGATGAVDAELDGAITRIIKSRIFRGSMWETFVLGAPEGKPFKKVIVVGLGTRQYFNEDTVREVSRIAAMKAVEEGVKSFATIIHGAGIGGLDVLTATREVVTGTVEGIVGASDKPEEYTPAIVEFARHKINRIYEAAREAADELSLRYRFKIDVELRNC